MKTHFLLQVAPLDPGKIYANENSCRWDTQDHAQHGYKATSVFYKNLKNKEVWKEYLLLVVKELSDQNAHFDISDHRPANSE